MNIEDSRNIVVFLNFIIMIQKSFEEIVVLWQADKKQYVKRSTYSS